MCGFCRRAPFIFCCRWYSIASYSWASYAKWCHEGGLFFSRAVFQFPSRYIGFCFYVHVCIHVRRSGEHCNEMRRCNWNCDGIHFVFFVDSCCCFFVFIDFVFCVDFFLSFFKIVKLLHISMHFMEIALHYNTMSTIRTSCASNPIVLCVLIFSAHSWISFLVHCIAFGT